MKYSSKIKNILFRSGIMALSRLTVGRGQAAILRYHSVAEPTDNFYASPSICVSPDEFEIQVRYLSKNYNIISLDEVADCIAEQRPFAERAVVLTFDDGYRDNYVAYKIMKSYGIRGTFYVTAGCIGNGTIFWLFEIIYLIRNTVRSNVELVVNGIKTIFSLDSTFEREVAIRKITEVIKSNNLEVREDIRKQLKAQIHDVSDLDEKALRVMLSWEQVQEMVNNGMTIGGHTMSHLNLPNAKYEDVVREIQDCKQIIEENTSVAVRHFSYPNGGNYSYYDESIIKIVKESGYYTATTSNNGLVYLDSKLYELKRVRVTGNLPEIVFQIQCEPIVKGMWGAS